jgi:hypothetical protein
VLGRSLRPPKRGRPFTKELDEPPASASSEPMLI